ncbi:hypothetical protein V8E54_013504 [Elaphomyces granulatus]
MLYQSAPFPSPLTSMPTIVELQASNDSAVLQALFDAESSPASTVTIDHALPPLPCIPADGDLEALKAREVYAIRQLQHDSSREAIEGVIAELVAVITENPSYPSAHVNRAQALRMLAEGGGHNDDQAITLTRPSSPTAPISPLQARILADAHTHRGYLLLKAAKIEPEERKQGGLVWLVDFFSGGRYGNKAAQQLAVQTNPYAKMCGAIVREAMRKEVEGV